MAHRTPSTSRSRRQKAQFFILSAFMIITMLLILSQFIQPSGIYDTSNAVTSEEIFIFNNIKEKSTDVVRQSENCNDLRLNLEEYKQFVETFAAKRNLRLTYNFDLTSCTDATLTTNFYVGLVSTGSGMDSTFTVDRN